jgi:hypothetical protein
MGLSGRAGSTGERATEAKYRKERKRVVCPQGSHRTDWQDSRGIISMRSTLQGLPVTQGKPRETITSSLA